MKAALFIVWVILAAFGARWLYVQAFGQDVIEYRGVQIHLSQKYTDYDAFKNDAQNLPDSELSKVESLMTQAKIRPTFRDWPEFVHVEFQLAFPGYGVGGGPEVYASGKKIMVSSIEIPSRPPNEKNRFFVLEELPDKSLKLIDDFVATGLYVKSRVVLDGTRLSYYDSNGAVVRIKDL